MIPESPRDPIAKSRSELPRLPDETCDRSLSTGPDHSAIAPDGVTESCPTTIGRYSIRRLLGRGAMGAVYLAHDPELDRAVALKVPRLSNADAQERFLREARAAAAVSHPNLCPVYDAGRANGVLYLAMAYIPGSTLTDLIREHGALPPDHAATIAIAVARGMAEAHRHGIIHRDLKPGNILINPRGEPVVTDFGLARRSGMTDLGTDPGTTAAHDPRLTQAGILMGTPAYMPPEQARGDVDRVGPVSDVYALGAILYEMLTGSTPFQSPTIPELLRKIESQPAPAPSGACADVPAGLDAVCVKALAKNPADRFESMEALAAALAPFAGGVKRRRWSRVAAAAAAFIFLLVAGTILYVKTDNGVIEVRLNDPNADVEVTVDGQEVVLTENGRVTKLRAGPHMLTVKGPNFETETRVFKVTRQDRVVLEVELKPKAPPVAVAPKLEPKVEPKVEPKPIPEAVPAPPPMSKPNALTPDQIRLAQILARGRRLLDQGRIEAVGKAADEALAIDPQSPGGLGLRAFYRAFTGDIDGARQDAEAALKLNPETWEALMARATVAAEEGRLDDAIADETVAIRIAPDNPRGWTNRSNSYLNKKEYLQAIDDANRAMKCEQGGPDALLNRASAYACLGQYKNALADFDEAAKLAPNDWRIFDHRSALHAKMENDELADLDWKKVKKLNPELRIQDRIDYPDPPKPVPRKKLTPEESTALMDAVARAELAFEQGQLDESRAAAEEALKIDPTSARAHAIRARLYGEAKQFSQALQAANEAIRLDPNSTWGYVVRGVCHMAKSDYAAAIADYTIALRIDPKNPSAWNNRGWAYSQRQQYHQAIRDFDVALQHKPNYSPFLSNRGMAYLYLGEYEKALADYSLAADLQPTGGRWLLVCSMIRAKLNDLPGAERDRKRAYEIEPKLKTGPAPKLPNPLPPIKRDPVIETEPAVVPIPQSTLTPERRQLAELLAHGRKLFDAGRFPQLGPICDQALALDPESPNALGLRAAFHYFRGNKPAAKTDADAALKLNPEILPALIVRMYTAGEEGRFDECIADANIAIRIAPTHPVAWSMRAQAYFEKGEFRQTIHDASQAIKFNFLGPNPLMNRASSYAMIGDYDRSVADYNEVLRRSANYVPALAQRAAVHAKAGKLTESADDWKRARLLDPTLMNNEPPVLPDSTAPTERKKLTPSENAAWKNAITQGEACYEQRRYDDAMMFANEAIRIDPTAASGHSLRGRIFAQSGNYPEALLAANDALRLDPNHAWAYVIRGAAKFSRKDYAGSIADQTVALTLDEKHSHAWYHRGRAYIGLQQYHQAFADTSESLRWREVSHDAHANRAVCYIRFGEFAKALADYQRAAELDPKNPRWLLACAKLRIQLNDLPGAEADRQRALKLDPQAKDLSPLPARIAPPKRDPVLPE